jgi:hypothetical protein
MVAFASAKTALLPWAVFPTTNPTQLDRGTAKIVLTPLLNGYSWSTLGDGVCPRKDAGNPDTTQVVSSLTSTPGGSYQRTISDNFANTDPDAIANAIMQTQDWDQRIRECTGEFKLLKVHTHNEHPYSIFPIYPAEWIKILGHVSRHQMGDAESSQIAYLLDLMKIIEVDVTHDRADLTGNNQDEAYKKRELLEGNPNNPRDLHHEFFIRHRYIDAERLVAYMKSRNLSTAWYEEVKAGKVYAYQKLVDNDPNGQCVQMETAKDSSGQVRFKKVSRNKQS